ncbi:uncharacterized protein LOC123006880 [Tribolium madens]|uniref:uncharacterized protein LOC123006880 n=1 Tax=Tribolium madens TaxID=41895 RepID=UPI001CF73F8F|nr:uncharacterized protein LOC123006880 [Tribolium madens]
MISSSEFLDSCFEELDYEYSDEEIDDLNLSYSESENGICLRSVSPLLIHLCDDEDFPSKKTLRREFVNFRKVQSKPFFKRKWKARTFGYIKLWRIRSSDACFDIRKRNSEDCEGEKKKRIVNKLCSFKAVIGPKFRSSSKFSNGQDEESPEDIDASISITFFNDLCCNSRAGK